MTKCLRYNIIGTSNLIDGEDYIMDSTTISIAAGEMSKSFTINIINDQITECDETFKLILISVCGVVSGITNVTEVTIKHDFGKKSDIISMYIDLLINRCSIVI